MLHLIAQTVFREDGGEQGGNTCNGGSNPPVQNGCVHPECSTGVKLDPSCSSCATSVCNADSYCCDVTWDSICVDAANTLCGGCN